MNKFKIGDKLKVKPECKGECGSCSGYDFDYIEIDMLDSGGYGYNAIKNGKKVAGCNGCYTDKHLIPLTKTLDDLQKGDVIFVGNSYYRKVLARLEDIVFLSLLFDKKSKKQDEYKTGAYTNIKELKEDGFTLVDPETLEPIKEDSIESIEIEGKKYNKEAVVERLKELKEVE